MWLPQASLGFFREMIYFILSGVFTHNGEIFKNDSFSSRIAVERKPKVSPG